MDNSNIKALIIRGVGLQNLINSKDEHLNDIPLKKWDNLAMFINCGSLSQRVVKLKQLAREIIEDYKNY